MKLVKQTVQQLCHILSEIIDYNLQKIQKSLNLQHVTRQFIDEYLTEKVQEFKKITNIPSTTTLRPYNYSTTRQFANESQISLMMMDNFHSFFTKWKELFKQELNQIHNGQKSISLALLASLYFISDYFHKEGYTSTSYPQILNPSVFNAIKRYSSCCMTNTFKLILIPYANYKTIKQSQQLSIPFASSTTYTHNIVKTCMVCFLFLFSVVVVVFVCVYHLLLFCVCLGSI